MSGGQGINAYGLRMVYESSDLETSTSTPSETSRPETGADATSGPSATATNDSSASTASADDVDDDDAGLSTGAIAAIAVVIPVVLISIGLGLFFFLRRRKQQSSANAAIANHDTKYPDQAESISGTTGHSSPQTGAAVAASTTDNVRSGELYGDMAHSPYQTSPPQELPAQSYVVELPADTPPQPPPKSSSFSVAADVTPSPMSEGGKSQGYFYRG